MRRRPSSRLLVLDRDGKVLLFRFAFKEGALAGQDYWGTPGGAVEHGETFEQAAIRELEEETGIRVEDIGVPVAHREVVLQLVNGEHVIAEEQYFLVVTDGEPLSRAGWSTLETTIMIEHRWWSRDELSQTPETVWPENLLAMLGTVASP